MKRAAIVGLGWLGMPLAMTLVARGWHICGSKTTSDGTEAARMCGIESYRLKLTPDVACEPEDLQALLNTDALVITLPASRGGMESREYLLSVQQLVDSALAFSVEHILFTSSTSVYGDSQGVVSERTPLQPVSSTGRILAELESWLHDLPGTRVDILRLAGLVGPNRHPGRFLAGKTGIEDGGRGVNLVHLDDVIGAISLLLESSHKGGIWNLCAPKHPARSHFYPTVARQLGLIPPQFTGTTKSGNGKIIDGSKICRELGFSYQYPDPNTMPVS